MGWFGARNTFSLLDNVTLVYVVSVPVEGWIGMLDNTQMARECGFKQLLTIIKLIAAMSCSLTGK